MTSVSVSNGVYTTYYASQRSMAGRGEGAPAGEADESPLSWRRRGSEGGQSRLQPVREESPKPAVVDGQFEATLHSINANEVPESHVAADAVDVLLQLRPQAGVALALGARSGEEQRAASLSDLYSGDGMEADIGAQRAYLFTGNDLVARTSRTAVEPVAPQAPAESEQSADTDAGRLLRILS